MSADTDVDIDYLVPLPPRSGGRVVRSQPARAVLVAGVVCFALWSLLASPTLLRNAEASPLSGRRSMAVALWRPLARASAWLGLDRFGSGIDAALGRTPAAALGRTPATPRPPHPSARPAPTATTLPSPVTTVAAVVPAAPPPTPLRSPTADRPLQVLVVGDSIAQALGYSLARRLSATGLARVTVDARPATGLSRPDYFNWADQLGRDLGRVNPDVVVVMFGGNDAQPFLVGGVPAPFASARWEATYRGRVSQLLAEAAASGSRVVWVGLPVMRSAVMSANARLLNAAYGDAVSAVSSAAFVDTSALLADAQGRYQAYLPDGAGHLQLVRQPDGIHLTIAGADRLAVAVTDTINSAGGR